MPFGIRGLLDAVAGTRGVTTEVQADRIRVQDLDLDTVRERNITAAEIRRRADERDREANLPFGGWIPFPAPPEPDRGPETGVLGEVLELQRQTLEFQRQTRDLEQAALRIREAPMPREDQLEEELWEALSPADAERIRRTFTPSQIVRSENAATYYVNGNSPDSMERFRMWMRDEWGNNIGDSTYGEIWKMSLERKKIADRGKPPFLERTFKQALGGKVKSAKGEIGLEIEVEGANLFNSPTEWWTVVGDGSLRNYKQHPPLEYVLREPIGRKDVPVALKYLVDRMKAVNSEIHMSHRCSVHVHVNVQQMRMLHLFNFVCLYYIFEDVLMEHAAPERRGNLFCLRAKDASYQIEAFAEALRTGNWPQMMQNEMRYSAMNPAAMGAHGSLEFRALSGTVDPVRIKDWVTILCALKDSSQKFINPASISRIFKSLGPKEFLFRVFDSKIPPEILKRWADDKMTSERIAEGYTSVRDVLFAIDWNDPPEHLKKVPARSRVQERIDEVQRGAQTLRFTRLIDPLA